MVFCFEFVCFSQVLNVELCLVLTGFKYIVCDLCMQKYKGFLHWFKQLKK